VSENRIYHKYFTKIGDNLSNRSIDTGQTPLMFSKSLEVTKLLLENGADPNLQNREGNSALHFSIARDDFETSKILIQWGARKDQRNLSDRDRVLKMSIKNLNKKISD